MKDGLRKVVHVEVFDFDKDTMAYAVGSHKNQFGYKYQTEYKRKGIIVKKDPEVNNVEKGNRIYNTLGINLGQLGSLRRLIKRIKEGKKGIAFPNEDGSVTVVIRGGSTITYRGDQKEDFYQKVLKIK